MLDLNRRVIQYAMNKVLCTRHCKEHYYRCIGNPFSDKPHAQEIGGNGQQKVGLLLLGAGVIIA